MQKKKSGVKKCLEISAIKGGGGGGGGPLMANAILNFHFDYLTPSLTDIHFLGSYTHASLDLPGLPEAFTYCTNYMVFLLTFIFATIIIFYHSFALYLPHHFLKVSIY